MTRFLRVRRPNGSALCEPVPDEPRCWHTWLASRIHAWRITDGTWDVVVAESSRQVYLSPTRDSQAGSG